MVNEDNGVLMQPLKKHQPQLEGATCWQDIENHLEQTNSNEKGRFFEEFSVALLKVNSKEFDTKAVYLGEDIPKVERNRLNLASKDLGQDGLLIKEDGTRVVFQSKYRGKGVSLGHGELGTFYSHAEHADERLLIRNTELTDNAKKDIGPKTNATQIDRAYLDNLSKETIQAIVATMLSNKPVPREPRKCWPIQQAAIDDLLALPKPAELKAPRRATCVMPCGTGKTLVSIRYAESVGAKRIVVLLPSLMLVEQVREEWCFDSKIADADYSCHVICSDNKKSKAEEDAIITAKTDLPFVRSTSAEEVVDYLKKNEHRHQIIFCTYQSTQVLIDGLQLANAACDLIIFDEAHRTVGNKSAFSLALSDDNLTARYRLFLTATPKQIDFRHTNKDGDFKELFSMCNTEVYGQQVMLDYRKAIQNERICDYKVLVVVVTHEDIQRAKLTEASDKLTIAHEIAIGKTMKEYGTQKIITFHRLRRDAKHFAEHKTENMPAKLICDYIEGGHSRDERNKILKEFRETSHGLLANARCLTEGVNIPSIDCVAFLSPKRSKVDIIQAIGRAMRKDKNNPSKKVGYVLLPVFIEDYHGETTEEAVADSNFDSIWDVLCTLKDFDPILAQCFERIAQQQGQSLNVNIFDALRDHIDISGVSLTAEKLRQHIAVRLADRLVPSWHIRYGELVQYKEEHRHCNVPDKDKENKQLGTWVGVQRGAYKKGKLDNDKVALLETIGFDWDPIESQWREKYAEIKAYKEEHGHCNVTDTENPQLGRWAQKQRAAYKRGKLDNDKVELLETIGFDWVPIDSQWQEKYAELKAYKEEHGHCNVLSSDKNKQLASWVKTQRTTYNKGKLDNDKVEFLEAIGFKWRRVSK